MTLAEFGKPDRQIAITRDALFEYLHMSRAIHRFDSESTAVHRNCREHVVAERLPVSRGLPQGSSHDFGRVDLLVSGGILRLAHVSDETLEQAPSLRVPEDQARRLFLRMEQVQFLGEPPMVAPLRPCTR